MFKMSRLYFSPRVIAQMVDSEIARYGISLLPAVRKRIIARTFHDATHPDITKGIVSQIIKLRIDNANR